MTQFFQMLLFLGVVSLILALMVAYAGRRLISPARLPRRCSLCLWAVLVVMAFAVPVTLVLSGLGLGPWFDVSLGASHLALGLFVLLTSLTLMRDELWIVLLAASFALRRAGRAGILPTEREQRRHIIHRTNLVIVPLAIVLLAIGMAQALLPPRVVNVQIPIVGLHPDLIGFRILQLSDIHLSPWVGGDHIRWLVTTANSLGPDIVAITGDLVDGSVEQRGRDAAILTSLDAPVFFVTGNHESFSGAERWVEFLDQIGIRVLDGKSELVRKGAATLLLAGVADPAVAMSGELDQSDPSEIDLTGHPAADLRVLLAHQPGAAYRAASAGFDLQLSGHTHGGQFFPLTFLIDFIQPFATGLHHYHGMWIYTSRGARFWGPPVRLFNPPEIALIELTAAE